MESPDFLFSPMPPALRDRPFGTAPCGGPVRAFTLLGANGMEAEILTYGGIVRRLLVPDHTGSPADVVLGFDNLEAYLAGHPYFGAIAGRVAGRITGGRFTIDGRTYELDPNDPPNHLHGGPTGFDKRVWSPEPTTLADGSPALRLTYRSPHLDQGYPGEVEVSVTYAVTAANALRFEWEARSDAPTPISLTHHSYFNLDGEGSGTATHHTLEIAASSYVPTDAAMTLAGRAKSVAGRPNDFRLPRPLADALPGLFAQHGDLYLLNPRTEAPPRFAARLTAARSGRVLEVSTTEQCLQLYTGVALDGSLSGKSGTPYGRHAGICLECEGYPDAANTPALGEPLLRPGESRRHTTLYTFLST